MTSSSAHSRIYFHEFLKSMEWKAQIEYELILMRNILSVSTIDMSEMNEKRERKLKLRI